MKAPVASSCMGSRSSASLDLRARGIERAGPIVQFAEAELAQPHAQRDRVPGLRHELVHVPLVDRVDHELQVCLRGEEDRDHVRQLRPHLGQEIEAPRAGHVVVADDARDLRVLVQHRPRLRRVIRVQKRVRFLPQRAVQRPVNGFLVVHDQQRRSRSKVMIAVSGSFARGGRAGSRRTVSLPRAALESIAPRWAFTISLHDVQPQAGPLAGGLVVKKGSRIRVFTSSGMPGPESSTTMRDLGRARRPPRWMRSRRGRGRHRSPWRRGRSRRGSRAPAGAWPGSARTHRSVTTPEVDVHLRTQALLQQAKHAVDRLPRVVRAPRRPAPRGPKM